MTYRVIKGDIVHTPYYGDCDLLIHGCNCQNVKGSGVAKALFEAYPTLYAADQATVKSDPSKLGSYTAIQTPRWDGGTMHIANLYLQEFYGRDPDVVYFDYEAFEQVLIKLSEDFKMKRVMLPMIGSGTAGGDWKRIESMIKELLVPAMRSVTVIQRPPNLQFLLIYGSRGFPRPVSVKYILNKWVHKGDFVIVSGVCPNSPDATAIEWAKQNKVDYISIPAKWNGQTGLDRAAGFKRNLELVKVATTAVGFIDGWSPGSTHTTDYLAKTGIPYQVFGDMKCPKCLRNLNVSKFRDPEENEYKDVLSFSSPNRDSICYECLQEGKEE